MKSKLSVLVLVVVLMALAATPIAASPLAAPCAPGAAYNPSCDVNQDGAVNVLDVQLTAGHWNQTGTWISDNDHNHLGQTWTGSNNPLKIQGSFSTPPYYAPLELSNALGSGLVVTSATAGGVVVGTVGGSGVVVGTAGDNGVVVGTVGGNGAYVNSAGHDGFVVLCTGNVGYCFLDTANNNGFEVANAEDYGVKVVTAGRAAFRSDDSGTNGLYVTTAGDSGVWVADATNWAGYFGRDIYVSGNCTGCLIANLAINSGAETLQAGDIVAMDGIAVSPFAGTAMLLQVRRATPGSPLLGVVSGRAEPYTSKEDGSAILAPRSGQAAAPGQYLSVVIYGPVQVKAAGNVQLGDRVTIADATHGVRALSTFQVPRTDGGLANMIEAAPVLGIALDDAVDGLVWVLVNPQ